jgi:hypothetical protein
MPPAPVPKRVQKTPTTIQNGQSLLGKVSTIIRLNGSLNHGSGMSTDTGRECPRGGLEEVPLGSEEGFLLAT